MNPIICPVRNNLHLTRKAVRTFKTQDISGGVDVLVVDNQSTDGTAQWLCTQHDVLTMHNDPALSVAASWNKALRLVFKWGAEYALVANNDTELRNDTYRRLVADGGGFVTAVGTRDTNKIKELTEPDPAAKRPHPDFSCYLIRRDVYEHVGEFDEQFLIAFGEDWDMHVRLKKAGVLAYCLDLPFLHHGSMTIKNSEPSEVRRIQVQADRNRQYFKSKWGFAGASKEYYDFFGTDSPKEIDA